MSKRVKNVWNPFEEMIVSQPWGGLGDNLQFSTIPRLCYENGISFGLSLRNQHRNQEIHDLVWKPNPYVTLTDQDHVGADHMTPPPQSDSKKMNSIFVVEYSPILSKNTTSEYSDPTTLLSL